MATDKDNYRFPPQSQPQQPGIEHIMNPLPEQLNPNYKPSNKLNGKVALVTGGDSGIGRSVCYHFALEGATVAFTYVAGIEDQDKEDTLETILKLKTKEAKDPIAIAVDVGFEENCKKVVDQVVGAYGTIDILVNNAAEQHIRNSLEDITEIRLERIFRTNIFAHFYMSKYAVKYMKEGSSIINTASLAAYQGNGELLDYCSTKAAIVGFTRGLSQLLIEKKIRVNAVAPGPIWTPLQVASRPAEEIVPLGSETKMGRAGQPWEVAPSYVFLASEGSSSYFTGQVLHPNGGEIVNT
ncbi:Glucose and ribitol dehydrogenase [Turnera subulata]|uniref:Glucose and ribitol dehydrogenase n=1 Tax=Turnera subulata TaxID=218843 RepID=A0A9Q0J150_9ROSI|nr:Glucose and ribitol dehydrogenase [Turnera subulata]